MLVIFGINLAKNKKVVYALPELYGIGLSMSKKICSVLGLAPNLKISELTLNQQFEIAKKIKEECRIENNLRQVIKSDISRYVTNGSFRGFRHRNQLPVRGQRTHSNGRTPKKMWMGMYVKKR